MLAAPEISDLIKERGLKKPALSAFNSFYKDNTEKIENDTRYINKLMNTDEWSYSEAEFQKIKPTDNHKITYMVNSLTTFKSKNNEGEVVFQEELYVYDEYSKGWRIISKDINLFNIANQNIRKLFNHQYVEDHQEDINTVEKPEVRKLNL
jgi:hypothetical protein